MHLLTLVRHGQASYMSADYDRLSPVGEEQSRKLAQFWIRQGITFETSFRGPAKRHARTLEIIAAEFESAGLAFPDPQVVPELDEFDAFRMMQTMTPVLSKEHPEIRALSEDFEKNRHTPEAGNKLQTLFEAVCRVWCEGAYDSDGLETWTQFRSRVASAIAAIKPAVTQSGSTVAITSGGPIAVSVGHALELENRHAIELLWQSRNCSFSELVFDRDRIAMHSFNSIPHLEERELVTYR